MEGADNTIMIMAATPYCGLTMGQALAKLITEVSPLRSHSHLMW